MKCIHCGYNSYNGNKGPFYELPIKLVRPSESMLKMEDTAYVYACPNCKKLFIVD